MAESSLNAALAIRKKLAGPLDVSLVPDLDRLEPLYQRLIALWVWSVGGEHPMVAIALDKVAAFYADQKKYDQAKEAADRALRELPGTLLGQPGGETAGADGVLKLLEAPPAKDTGPESRAAPQGGMTVGPKSVPMSRDAARTSACATLHQAERA